MNHLTVQKSDFGYSVTFTLTDASGTGIDPSAYDLYLQVWRPSAPSTYIVNSSQVSTGGTAYTCTYTIKSTDFTSSTVYAYRILGSSSSSGIQKTLQTGLLAVPDSAYYCTLDEVKEELHITSDDMDFRILSMIMQAQTFIDNYCKRTFAVGTAGTVKYYDGAESPLWIDDCTAITAIALDEEADGTWSSSMAATDWLLKPYNTNPKTYIVLSPNSDYGSFCSGVTKGVKITGTWGYDTSIPEDVRRAAIIQCCHWFQRGKTGYATYAGNADVGLLVPEKGLDTDVKQILEPYRKVQYVG